MRSVVWKSLLAALLLFPVVSGQICENCQSGGKMTDYSDWTDCQNNVDACTILNFVNKNLDNGGIPTEIGLLTKLRSM